MRRSALARALARSHDLPGILALSALFLAGLPLLPACASDGTAPNDPRPGAAAFDRFWQDFDETYPYFVHKQIDWNAGRAELRERAAAATTDQALVEVMREAVEPLRDVHAWFIRPDGSMLPSYIPDRPPNWDKTLWLSYLQRLDWRQGVTNWGWGRVGDVGYLAIGGWNTAQVKIEDLDAALAQLRDTQALVLDVRMNAGGSDALALQLAGRFARSRIRFESVRYRNGPNHSDFGGWNDRFLSPRGPWQYTNPVYLLIGPGCFSSNESFIAAMGELPHVTLAGDTTGGSSGNPKQPALAVDGRDTGWKYAVPSWMAVLTDGTVIEWNGIPPNFVVPFDAASIAAGRDPVLEWAFLRAGAPLDE